MGAALLLLVTACDPGTVTPIEVPPPPPPKGTVIEVSVVRPDGSRADDALVHYLRFEEHNYRWQSVRTDDEGQARLDGLRGGDLYWITAQQADPVLGVLGGGEKRRAAHDAVVELAISLAAPRTQGLVISEVFMAVPPVWETGNMPYIAGLYLEVFNNSEELMHLDGRLIGKGYSNWKDLGSYGHHRCEDTQPMRNDPEGVWSYSMWRFPGSGGDYPLAPGEAAVIARLAADHRDVHPTLLDLSGADFEFIEPGEADNPSAGNMIHLGPSPVGAWSEFGLHWSFWFVAAPTAMEAIPVVNDPGTFPHIPRPHQRVPAAALDDVAYIWWDNTGGYNPLEPGAPCTHPVHPSFDAIPGGFMKSGDLTLSAQRRRVSVEGRSVLLDTNTSQIDFERAERTPGWVP